MSQSIKLHPQGRLQGTVGRRLGTPQQICEEAEAPVQVSEGHPRNGGPEGRLLRNVRR